MKKREAKAAEKLKIKKLEFQQEEKEDKSAQKRRGRKREKNDMYFKKAQDRIEAIKSKLKTAY